MPPEPAITYSEFCTLYSEALDCHDWQTCDSLSDNYPEHAERYFFIDPLQGDYDPADPDSGEPDPQDWTVNPSDN